MVLYILYVLSGFSNGKIKKQLRGKQADTLMPQSYLLCAIGDGEPRIYVLSSISDSRTMEEDTQVRPRAQGAHMTKGISHRRERARTVTNHKSTACPTAQCGRGARVHKECLLPKMSTDQSLQPAPMSPSVATRTWGM